MSAKKVRNIPKYLLTACSKAQSQVSAASGALDLAADDLEGYLLDHGDQLRPSQVDAADVLIDRLRHISEQVNDLDTEAMDAIAEARHV